MADHDELPEPPLAAQAPPMSPDHDAQDLGHPGKLSTGPDAFDRSVANIKSAELDVPVVERRKITRRTIFFGLAVAANAAVAALIATPVVAYLFSPVLRRKEYRHWIDIGKASDYKRGETRLIDFLNPFTDPWDGDTAKLPAYVRVSTTGEFSVFAINCAHLGCPVHWFPESQLFMCPCHGGIYYADGSRAAGPPERGLFKYPQRIQNGRLQIDAGEIPTLSNQASLSPIPGSPVVAANSHSSLVTRITPCPGTEKPLIG